MKCVASSSRKRDPARRSEAESMSRAPVSMSHLPAMNVTGTSIFDSDTRWCSETPRASLAYHEGCVVQNSCISVRSSAGSAVRVDQPRHAEHVRRRVGPRDPPRQRCQRTPGHPGRTSEADHQLLRDHRRQAQGSQHRGERVARDAGHGEDALDSLGVAAGQLERDRDSGRPGGDDRRFDAGVVHDGEGVLDEGVEVDPVVGRPLGAADATVVPRHDVHAAVGSQQRRPRMRIGAQAVRQEDRRTFGVVGPGPEAGAVGALDVVVADEGGRGWLHKR